MFLRIFSNCLGNVYQKKLTQKECNPFTINAFTYLFLSLFCIPFLFTYSIDSVKEHFWINSAIVGILGALGNGFLVKAFQDGEFSVLGPLNSYKAVFGLIFAFVLLKEVPNIWGIAGILIIIFGSYLVLNTLSENFNLDIIKNKSIHYRFLALVFCSAEAVFIKKVILLSSVWDAFVAWCFFGTIFSFLMLKVCKISIRKEFNILKTRNASFLINVVICMGIMQLTTNYVFQRMNVAYALALFQLSTIVCVFLGYKVFHEKEIKKRLIGALIMLAGAVIIILYN